MHKVKCHNWKNKKKLSILTLGSLLISSNIIIYCYRMKKITLSNKILRFIYQYSPLINGTSEQRGPSLFNWHMYIVPLSQWNLNETKTGDNISWSSHRGQQLTKWYKVSTEALNENKPLATTMWTLLQT